MEAAAINIERSHDRCPRPPSPVKDTWPAADPGERHPHVLGLAEVICCGYLLSLPAIAYKAPDTSSS
jgi:hypothetical protein